MFCLRFSGGTLFHAAGFVLGGKCMRAPCDVTFSTAMHAQTMIDEALRVSSFRRQVLFVPLYISQHPFVKTKEV